MRVERGEGRLVVDFGFEARVVATVPPGVGRAARAVFARVPRGFRASSVEEAFRAAGAPPGSLAFLTAADPAEAAVVGGGWFTVVATVGLELPVCPGGGGAGVEPLPAATINVLVVVERGLADHAAVDLLRVVAEAKAAAAADALLRCRGGPPWRSVGTVTDAVAVAYRPGGAGVAGHATSIGGPVGRAVYEAVLSRARPAPEALLERALGLTLEGLLGLFERVYAEAPLPGLPPGEARGVARRLLAEWLSDPNVASLLVAARELDIHGASGSIPGLPGGDYLSDYKGLVADELLGALLADYLEGSRGVLAAYWVERLKERGAIPEAEPFADDAVSALLGALVAGVAREWRRSRARS